VLTIQLSHPLIKLATVAKKKKRKREHFKVNFGQIMAKSPKAKKPDNFNFISSRCAGDSDTYSDSEPESD